MNIKLSEPTMNGVIDAVHEVQRAWDSKRSNGRLGRAKRLFHQFCGTLKSHQSFLEILPSGNEYVSIFTGTLNVLIQVGLHFIEEDLAGGAELTHVLSRQVPTTKRLLRGFRNHYASSVSMSMTAKRTSNCSTWWTCRLLLRSFMLTFFFSWGASWTG